jgi:hypothetical protein
VTINLGCTFDNTTDFGFQSTSQTSHQMITEGAPLYTTHGIGHPRFFNPPTFCCRICVAIHRLSSPLVPFDGDASFVTTTGSVACCITKQPQPVMPPRSAGGNLPRETSDAGPLPGNFACF